MDLKDAENNENPERISQEIVWDISFPLVTNVYIMGDMLAVWGITWVLMSAILLVMGLFSSNSGTLSAMLEVIPILGLVCLGLFVVSVLIMAVIFKNRFSAVFMVNAKGASYNVSRAQSKLNTAVAVLGAIAGKPGVAGAGLLAKAQEGEFFAWSDVFRVDLHSGRHVVILRNSWRTMVRLYCTPENYDAVARMALDGVAGASDKRARHVTSQTAVRRLTGMRLFNRWTALAFLSTIGITLSPFINMDDYGLIILGLGCIVLISAAAFGSLRKLFAIVGLVSVVWLVLLTIKGAGGTGLDLGVITLSKYELTMRGSHAKYFLISAAGLAGWTVCALRNLITARE